MGIGDWGLGIGDWGLGPIPNPHLKKFFKSKIMILKYVKIIIYFLFLIIIFKNMIKYLIIKLIPYKMIGECSHIYYSVTKFLFAYFSLMFDNHFFPQKDN